MPDNQPINRINIEILRLVMNNARLSNKEIAKSVGLAPSSCLERLKNLRERGVLLGAHSEVNLKALGLSLEAVLLVQLAKLKREAVDAFMKRTSSVTEVRNLFLLSGRFDLIVHVAVRDMEHLKEIISIHFNRHAAVVRVETSMVFDHKVRHAIPLVDSSGFED